MAKAIYYMKLSLLNRHVLGELYLEERIPEIKAMADFVSVFYAPQFLTAERAQDAQSNDFDFAWQMANLSRIEPVYKSVMNHCWYLDPTAIPLSLAASDNPVEMVKVAKAIFNQDRPAGIADYDIKR